MKFAKPKGAVADLRELEYISTLHQTGSTIRRDGSIRTDDITKFLMSRYGIKVTETEVASTIAKGFGGGGISEEDGDTLDLCEIAAMLLVPTLLKAEMSLHRDHLEREKIRGRHLHLGNDDGDGSPGTTADDSFSDEEHDLKFHLQKSGPDDVWNSVNDTSKSLRGEDRWPDYDLINLVLSMILRDVTGDDKPKPMTKELLKEIFVFYGEHDVSEDDRLLEEMILVASKMQIVPEGESTKAEPILDAFTFAHCLTMDVRAYNPKTEGRLSTNFHDVYQSKNDQHGASISEDGIHKVKHVFTFASIDYAVDTFRSKLFVTLLWVTWALFFWVFMNGQSNASLGNLNCTEKHTGGSASLFGCDIAQGIINWLLIMSKLVIIGSGFVILSSAGHSINHEKPRLLLFFSFTSMGFISLMTFVPAFHSFTVLKDEDTITDDDFFGQQVIEGGALVNTSREGHLEYEIWIVYLIVACGVVLMLLSIQNLLDQLVPVEYKDKYKWLKKCLVSGTVTMERNMKQAAAFKVNHMVRNARAIHKAAEFEHGAGSSSRESSCGRALLAYTKLQEDQELVSGWFWVWRRLLNGKLFVEDGIWLNNRMLQGNIAQLIICIWLIPFLKVLIGLIEFVYESFLADYSPQRWTIVVPIAIAFACAEFNALKLASCYIPSSVKTTLNFRHGVLGSLHDDEFQKLRTSVDGNSFLFGAMFWGCLLSSAFILIITFLIFALICFEKSRPYFVATLATVIGISITVMAKSLFLSLSRKFFHDHAFYRTNPAAANFTGVILESWSLGITTLYVVKRMITLIGAAFFFVGRIDVPFLSKDADEIGPVKLDNFPFVFRKDLVLHEAHRHPYIERIGLIYMLKLRYRDSFGREAGTSWRLLFVFALMPWLRKYRLRSSDIDVGKFKFSKESDTFKKFNPNKAGVRGRLSTVSEDDSNTTIVDLKNEINDLKEENSRIKELEEEVKELRLRVATVSQVESVVEEPILQFQPNDF